MGFLELLVTASMPILKLLLVTGVGSFLATGHINILGEDARKHLNNVSQRTIMQMFLPKAGSSEQILFLTSIQLGVAALDGTIYWILQNLHRGFNASLHFSP